MTTDQPPYDLAIYVGRFQPPHAGHFDLIRHGLARAARLLVVIGSAGAARRPDTLPFTAGERQAMILAGLAPAERDRVIFAAVPDVGDLALWAEAVRAAAAPFVAGRVVVVGCFKDATSDYLTAFAGWDLDAVEQRRGGLSATKVRERLFDRDQAQSLLGPGDDSLPEGVKAWLADFLATPQYADLAEEWAFAQHYRAAWSVAPYLPVFVTADAVVIHRGEVLLIERKHRPGKGLLALPGGFVDQDERVLDAAVRELAEETGLTPARGVLTRAIAGQAVFDDPRRDIRGRMITHAVLIRLDDAQPRPEAVAADDAADLGWHPIATLARDRLYGDHFLIIQHFIRQLAAA
jgi:bifunctional NMN adenylyltransferase/nudix hydrolase